MHANGYKIAHQTAVPEGLPTWITAEVIADMLRTLPPHYEHDLTNDEVIEMLLRIGGLLGELEGDDRE